jgi:hypothetical protein
MWVNQHNEPDFFIMNGGGANAIAKVNWKFVQFKARKGRGLVLLQSISIKWGFISRKAWTKRAGQNMCGYV